MTKHIKIVSTDFKNPWINLALEEYFLIKQPIREATLFLWQNKETVVIGRNQNPWTECNLPKMEEDSIRLARRISGGGAVFHDIGNLNFSFIMDREIYDVKRQCKVIINALKSLGINATMSGRNDITINDKKVSGNAFCFRGRNGLHHGTILIGADKEKMARYLTVSKEKIKAKGVTSVKSRVVNLCDIEPNITVDIIKDAVIDAFIKEYGTMSEQLHFSRKDKKALPKDTLFRNIITRNGSWEWNYGETPDFDIKLENRFSWGGTELYFKVDDAKIEKAEVYTDAIYEEIFVKLPNIFVGARLKGQELAQRLNDSKSAFKDLSKDTQVENQVLNDLSSWLLNVFK